MNNPITIEIWGPFACWTRPDCKVERLTYAVPTPSGIRGVLSAIYSKPAEFYWQIERIEVLNPIRYISFKCNEVKTKAGRNTILVEEDRTQRQTVALQDVRYRITASIIKREDFGGTEAQLLEQFRRRVEGGKCYFQPSMGLRQFPAYFEWGSSGDKPIELDLDLGWMVYDVFDLHKWKITKKAEPAVSLFHAQLTLGVLDVPPYDSELVLKGGAQDAQ